MSNKINPNDPAFPFVEPNTTCNLNTGLSIREEFAARAMQGILASYCVDPVNTQYMRQVAEGAVMAADALINELNKEV